MKTHKLKILCPSGPVSAILDSPDQPFAGMTLAHGAGAGMEHPFLVQLSQALTSVGFAVLRFQFPYMEGGKKRTDSSEVATATVAAAVLKLSQEIKGPVFGAGKSFGARMTTTTSANGLLPDLKGILCFGFPLHPAGSPSVKRAEHLNRVPCPILFLQGTRDALADLKLMRKVSQGLPNTVLHEIEGADHGFNVLKRSGHSPEWVFDQLAQASLRFAQKRCRGG